MKPIDVANRLKVSDSTVRQWTRLYAAFLTASATPDKGERRDYTLHDLQVLALVNDRSRRSIRRDDIQLELERLQADDWRELPPLEELTRHPEGSDLVPVETAQAMVQVERVAMQRELNDLRERERQLKAELESERAGRLDDRERLMREVAAAQAAQREAEAILKLYEQGRLQPPE